MKRPDRPTPAQRPYRPHGAAEDLFYCHEPEILIDGPAGTGKTRAVLEKVNAVCSKYKGARILICRKTRKSMSETILVTWEQKVLPEQSPLLGQLQRSHRETYTYPNGSHVVCGGLDNPGKIMSGEYDLICVFEATECTEDDWEKLASRLRNHVVPYQQIIGDCNPAFPSHWLNGRAAGDRMTRLLSRFGDNPSITEEYLGRLKQLTGVRYERLYLGRWVAAEGAVWPEYDARIHLVDSFMVPGEWRRFCSVDFGYTNPFVCQWWAIDGDGRLFLYRELYMTHRTVREHAKIINGYDENIEAYVCDHDAEDRATLHENDIPTMAARKDVKVGLQVVANRLRPITLTGEPDDSPTIEQIDGGDYERPMIRKKARLYFMRDSLIERDADLASRRMPCCTAEEIEGYLWRKAPDGSNPKEEPDKQHCPDHGCDALRYAVMYEDGGASSGAAFFDEPSRKERLAWRDKPITSQDDWLSPDNEALWEKV